MSNVQLDIADSGLAVITFNQGGSRVNTLGSAVLKELKTILENIKGRSTIKVVAFASAKEGCFIAGADIAEIKDIVNPSDAMQKAHYGQDICNLIASLPFITVALIDGACLGGGMELALACDLRIASDNPKCKLGLPEVSLGIIPGFGGTQRLPQIAGLTTALDLILGAKVFDTKKGYRFKIIDTYFKKEFFKDASQKLIQALLEDPSFLIKSQKRRAKKPLLQKVFERTSIGRKIVYSKTKKLLLSKTKGQYPAPLEALAVIERTYPSSSNGYTIEREHFAKVAVTDISKNLIQVFFTSEALKKESGVSEEVEIKHVDSAAVIGAGIMGGGIAWALSMKDISVRMKDITWDAINIGFSSAAKMYSQLIRIRKLNKHQVAVKMQHIGGSLDFTGFSDRDIAIEAVVENMEIKKKVLKECEEHLPPNAILASNTSSLSITEMASALDRPSKFVGMHFFNPVNRMPLVEVIAGKESSNSVIASVVTLSKKLGKTPIVVQDCPGFLVNRILIPYLNEAVKIWQEGGDIEQIDATILDYGMPMGPFTLTDEVGIDIGYHVAKILEEGYGERMKTAPIFDSLMANPSLRGKKSGKGFYLHSGKKQSINPEVRAIRNEYITTTSPLDTDTIIKRCIYSMINESARCIEEGIVQNPEYLDMAMILGSGFPPFRGGPLRYADSIGLKKIVSELELLTRQYGSRFEPAPLLTEKANKNQTFYQ
ncbi:MAG: 3-hydroxyacyl-CoA dehydrogenase NAD-binding domain-containing protein [Fibrobacterales bacterium]